MDINSDRISAVEERLTHLESAQKGLTQSIEDNTAITRSIEGNTKELLDLFIASKGAIKVVGWLGSFIKWFAILAASVLGAYTAIKAYVNGA